MSIDPPLFRDVTLKIGVRGERRIRLGVPTQGDKLAVHELAGHSRSAALLETLWMSRAIVEVGSRPTSELSDAERLDLVKDLTGVDFHLLSHELGELLEPWGVARACPRCGHAI